MTLYSQRQQAILTLFDYSELWNPMGYRSADEALGDVDYEEIEVLMERESHNLEDDIKEIMETK